MMNCNCILNTSIESLYTTVATVSLTQQKLRSTQIVRPASLCRSWITPLLEHNRLCTTPISTRAVLDTAAAWASFCANSVPTLL